MAASYSIPVGVEEVELRFKNSRFIGVVGPAASVEEARAFIDSVRAKYADAGHLAQLQTAVQDLTSGRVLVELMPQD